MKSSQAVNCSKLAIALAAVFGVSAAALADVSIVADTSARVGTLSRSGDWNKDFDNTKSGVDGNFAVFFAASKDLKNGYNVSFDCHTVATTVSGANAGFTADSLPVRHAWDQYFAGRDNWQNNGHGGFASYGDVNGDNKGPFCNDEVYGTMETPYGRFQVGNIMNPMRLLYDNATVDPVWGDQRGYYDTADLRGSALRYGNSFGPVSMELQWNSDSNANESKNMKGGNSLTGVAFYDFGNGTVLGAGVQHTSGDHTDKYAVAQAGAAGSHDSYGFAAKTLLNGFTLGYTYFYGDNKPANYEASGVGTKYMLQSYDNTFKVAYDLGKWSLQGFLSLAKQKFATPAAWGGSYTVLNSGAFQGKSFNHLVMDRTNVDLWALYNLGGGQTPYLRFNTIEKKYTSSDLAGYEADARATKIEAGWMLHF